ncbi:PREDICTED: flavonol synthase/flavanone 3-hydroxylase-like [Camelina sativa]|uniref:Flavonol synthase/flavanone 3-hydroxylase-like n=1 Tax=Camelina sativa TaxID=90675 RepID=A0ABM0T274_CAMSA|nr:PREDICTED: flavonol synthase/flavanone 3-hydroxylase-like [Camelina sativa]
MSFLRINRYPPCPRPDLALGVGQHKDVVVLTVLAQDEVGRLQVSRRSDGVWFPVRPVPNALVINLGNCIEIWTNDNYWSAEHRVVVNTTRERYSIPFFLLPSHDVEVKPLDELVSPESPPRRRRQRRGRGLRHRSSSSSSSDEDGGGLGFTNSSQQNVSLAQLDDRGSTTSTDLKCEGGGRGNWRTIEDDIASWSSV